jgi:bifunctional non-homologous end joining protein LigD
MRAARTSRGENADLDTVRLRRHAIEITHPDKVMFTRPRVTKRDLVRHYEQVAAAMLPHVRARPLALESYPQGTDQRGFLLKSIPAHFPDWIDRAEIPKKGGSLTQVIAGPAATFVYLAGQNVVTPHIWLSRVDALREPDRLIIDLDPAPGVGFAAVRAAARSAGERLRDDGLVPHAMVTGSRGIHVVCPLRRGPSFSDVHAYARAVAEDLVATDPRRLTLEWRRSDRGPRIYLDVNRINYAQHAVAPYAVRARPKAPVAMPIHWAELDDRWLAADRWTTRTAAQRLRAEGDAWRGIGRRARALPKR